MNKKTKTNFSFKKVLNILKKYKFQLAIVVLVVVVVLQFLSGCKTTLLEKKYIENRSNNIIPYITSLEKASSKDLDKYIIYAVEYNYNEKNQKNISLETVVNTINNTFNKKVTEEQVIKVGITPEMVDAHVGYDNEKREFISYADSATYADIAATKINIYVIDEISKSNSSKFKVTYKKYVVSNPYDILNYYDSQNNVLKSDKEQANRVDTTDMLNYLTGKGNLKTIQKYFKDEEVKQFAKEKGKIVVTYVFENELLKIDEINVK